MAHAHCADESLGLDVAAQRRTGHVRFGHEVAATEGTEVLRQTSVLGKLKSLLLGSGVEEETRGTEPSQVTPARAGNETDAAALTLNYEDPRIPKAARPRLQALRALMSEIERQASKAHAGADALLEARRIERIYLPQLLQSYFDIGAAHRIQVFRETGKSASFLLNDRLDTLINQLTAVSEDFARGRISNFSKHLDFIDQRFDSRKSPFDL